jgi:hypothetical protein
MKTLMLFLLSVTAHAQPCTPGVITDVAAPLCGPAETRAFALALQAGLNRDVAAYVNARPGFGCVQQPPQAELVYQEAGAHSTAQVVMLISRVECRAGAGVPNINHFPVLVDLASARATLLYRQF